MNDDSTPYFSRFAVISAGTEAWATDSRFRLYAFDGQRFWRRRRHSTRYAIVPSWRTPAFGWMHVSDCSCHLCEAGSCETMRPAA